MLTEGVVAVFDRYKQYPKMQCIDNSGGLLKYSLITNKEKYPTNQNNLQAIFPSPPKCKSLLNRVSFESGSAACQHTAS